ncbi:hypothetical protein [Albirhodobacter sp. R86504]|jgi:predicted small lipoprotein YifL|uniref:hypothetical protein n=1 Tax=Albirhodobacter sp. R86504 TaxID=3093848 RepID=UPI003671920D
MIKPITLFAALAALSALAACGVDGDPIAPSGQVSAQQATIPVSGEDAAGLGNS